MDDRLRKLLITLVLTAVAASTTSTAAHARLRLTLGVRSHASVGVMVGSSVAARPASGEPDAGSSKNPPLVIGQTQIVSPSFDGGATANDAISGWFQRIGMIWMARLLGVR